MKNLFALSLFALGAMLTSNTFAATGTGHAQAELTNPLSVANITNANLGIIAIDPGAGTQTVSISDAGAVTCPATYVCSGSPTAGTIRVTGSVSTAVSVSIVGSTATLSDGSGNTLIFDPFFMWGGSPVDSFTAPTNLSGNLGKNVGGEITFTGAEVMGTYSST
ncbi:MAG: DUF4402 domain-containing protein, partial [Alphaproteobacteria bacterium]|nr:DUF4402 domain-containing protein [Alphaproteobacteria bacterium]